MSAFSLKVTCFVLMVLDHIYWFILGTPIWFNYIGRIVAPIYFFLLVESFFYTRDRWKFTRRLFIAAGFTFILVNVLFKQPMNIFLSMALGILMLNFIEILRNKDKGKLNKIFAVFGVVFSVLLSFFTEASYLGVFMVLIFYFFRERKFLKIISYIIISLIDVLFLIGTQDFIKEIFVVNYQWMMVFSIIPILLYNGKAGYRSKFFNYFFYIAYPVHIIVLLIIGNSLNPTWYSF